MKRILYIIAVFLSFCYANAQTANYNFDFEDWHTDSLAEERLDQWAHIAWNDMLLYQLHGTKKSTQSQSGNYAVTLHRWYMVAYDVLRLKHAITQKPNFLNGFYIYTDVALAIHPDSSAINDVAAVTMYFTKWNTVMNRPDTIGYGYQELLATTGYTPFSCAITYTTADLPDSFYMYIRPTKNHSGIGCKDSSACSFLTVDNLTFSNVTSIKDAHAANDKIELYPNPAKEELFIKTQPGVIVQKIQLTDITGKIVMMLEGNNLLINISQLSPGNYFLRLQTDKGAVVRKIVVE